MKGFWYGVAATLGAVYPIGTLVMNFGFVDVAVSAPHSAMVKELMHTTAHKAIGRAADEIEVPNLATFDKAAGERV